MKLVVRGLLLSLVLAAVSATGLQAAEDVKITPDVVYGHKDGLALTFDVFSSESGIALTHATIRLDDADPRSGCADLE